mmetsp:Transcript_42106/g.47933  ORF Transcript_42106/g.47933 Transcript_42106/m.47933 type:complete len:113 (-) Transcript_42106:260-598(-)
MVCDNDRHSSAEEKGGDAICKHDIYFLIMFVLFPSSLQNQIMYSLLYLTHTHIHTFTFYCATCNKLRRKIQIQTKEDQSNTKQPTLRMIHGCQPTTLISLVMFAMNQIIIII